MHRNTLKITSIAVVIAGSIIASSLFLRPPGELGVKEEQGDPFIQNTDSAQDSEFFERMQSVLASPAVSYKDPRELTDDEVQLFKLIFRDLNLYARFKSGEQSAELLGSYVKEPQRYFDMLMHLAERAKLRAQLQPDRELNSQELQNDGGWNHQIESWYLNRTSQDFWEQIEPVRIMTSEDEQFALLTARVRNDFRNWPGIIRLKFRSCDSVGWRIYDVCRAPYWDWDSHRLMAHPVMTTVAEVMHLATSQDMAQLDEKLAKIRGIKLPPHQAACRAYAEGRLAVLRQKPGEAGTFFTAAVEADPHWPLAYLGVAEAANSAGRHDDADKMAKTIFQNVGVWPPAAEQEAIALEKLSRKDEATAVRAAIEKLFPKGVSEFKDQLHYGRTPRQED